MDNLVDDSTRVLLVEDNPDDALLVQEVLNHSKLPYPVSWVSTLTDAVAFLADNEVDVVLLDLMLPESRGLDTIDKMRQQAPAVPIVVLTGAEGEDLDQAGERHGVRSLLAKAHLGDKDYLAGALRYAISRRQADQALVAAEQRLNFALEASGAGSWSYHHHEQNWEFDGPVQYAGDPGRSAFGHRDFLAQLETEACAKLQEQINQTLAANADIRLEYNIANSAGKNRTIRLHGKAGQRDGEIVGICWDVTQSSRLMDRLSKTQKLESLELLAGGVAHDFNNLLTTIMGNAGLCISNAGEDSSISSWLKEIEMAALSAADLTRQLLAYSGKGRFAVKHLDLVALIRDTDGLLHSAVAPQTDLRLNLPTSPLYVQADETQLRQILLNLVRNGSESLRDKEGTVTVTAATVRGNNGDGAGKVLLEVSDNGEGMTEADIQRIFDPFFTTKLEGRGLGLAAVNGIVKAHGGRIDVQSSIGEGTRMKVTLPVAPLFEPAKPQPIGRVLVADDDASIRKMIAHLLQHLGYETIHAGDGQEAVELFKVHHKNVELVLMDLSMPRLSGTDAAAQIQAHSSHIPVIMMSGYSEEDLPVPAEGTPSTFIHKPFSAGELKNQITAVLK
ncbi:MAG: response regulator [Lysobacterales bacterium]